MKQNSKVLGNRFQQDFVKSVSENVLVERYRDAPVTFRHVDNPADFWMFNGKFITLIECKTTQEYTFALSNIRRNQLMKLLQHITYKNVFGGFLIEYRSLEKCFYVAAENFTEWFLQRDRESIPFNWIKEHGVEIPGTKLRTHFRWDINKLLEWIEVNCYNVKS